MRYLIPLVFLLACVPPPQPVPPKPVPGATCATVCANLRALGCPEADPSPNGVTCEQTCQNNEDGDIASLRWNLACLAGVIICAEVDYCTVQS